MASEVNEMINEASSVSKGFKGARGNLESAKNILRNEAWLAKETYELKRLGAIGRLFNPYRSRELEVHSTMASELSLRLRRKWI